MNADDEVARRVQQKRIDREVENKMRIIEDFGEDDFPDETLFKFYKRYEGTDKTYTYVALKVGGKWFLTGPTSPRAGMDWDEFLVWLVSGVPASPLIVMVPEDGD